MFILLYYLQGKGTKKSANRTYAIYGFIYPFYGFHHFYTILSQKMCIFAADKRNL